MDLSGNENIPHSQELVRFFREAKEEYGLGVSIHAGETGNAENIRWAIEDCRAQRIGHGSAAHNNPKVLDGDGLAAVIGAITPENYQESLQRDFSSFVKSLPRNAFVNGEPKGYLVLS